MKPRRHSPHVGPAVMLNRTSRSVGKSYRRPNALAVEVLGDAISACHLRRDKIALDAYTDRMYRPCPGLMIRKIGNNCIYKLFSDGRISHVPPNTHLFPTKATSASLHDRC